MKKIKIYSLSRNGHHAISLWLADNTIPKASVILVYNGEVNDIAQGSNELVFELHENEKLENTNEPSIIILRDPYNSLASFLKLTQNTNFGPLSFFPYMRFWKEYADEITGKTNILSNKLFISYNNWFSSLEYRKKIIEELRNKFSIETKFSDELKNRMTKYGGGSSFDGLSFMKSADKMDVLLRYKDFEKSVSYKKRVDIPEINELSKLIFNFYPFEKVENKGLEMMQFLDNFWS